MPNSPVPANRAGRKPGQKNYVSIATISRGVIDDIATALKVAGGPKFWVKLSKTNPVDFAKIAANVALRHAAPSETAGFVFNLVQLTSNPTPTPGVLSSPIEGDVAPQRHLQLVERSDV